MSFYLPPWNNAVEPSQTNVRQWLDNLYSKFQPIEQSRWNQSNIDTLFYAGSQTFVNRYFNFSPTTSYQQYYFNLIQHGNTIQLGERDCTVQRRHQKLIEETPSPVVDEALRKKMGDAAVAAARAINYEGAGTIEFLLDKHKDFYFMEMNTRIQVEHPVTEERYDVDLVKEQILIAAVESIEGRNFIPKGHSIECRINAEDPEHSFRPSPGQLQVFHTPGGHGVRVDSHAYASYVVPSNYDSMIAKLIVTAHSRDEAIARMSRALDEFIVVGIKTTIPFHKQVMHSSVFQSGDFDTSFLESFRYEKK